MDVETTFGFTTCLYEVRQLRYGPARVVRGKRASTGRFNQDTAMADLYRAVLIKVGPANPCLFLISRFCCYSLFRYKKVPQELYIYKTYIRSQRSLIYLVCIQYV